MNNGSLWNVAVAGVLSAVFGLGGCDRKPESSQIGNGTAAPGAQSQRTAPPASENGAAEGASAAQPAAGEEAAHSHAARHGGVLIEIGEHAAQVELVLDADAGTLTAHVMDGCAEKAVRIEQPQIVLKLSKLRARTDIGDVVDVDLKTSFQGAGAPVRLSAVTSSLSGEKPGDSATFDVGFTLLKGAVEFEGVITEITVLGKTYNDVPIRYPAR